MFVKSVVSRAGRVVVSADQLRVVLRVVLDWAAERHNAAMHERLAEDFGGYLVTECERAEVVPVFSERRWLHEHGSCAMTGVDMARSSSWQSWVGDDIKVLSDAPGYVVAGSCVPLTVLASGMILARASLVRRGGE